MIGAIEMAKQSWNNREIILLRAVTLQKSVSKTVLQATRHECRYQLLNSSTIIWHEERLIVTIVALSER